MTSLLAFLIIGLTATLFSGCGKDGEEGRSVLSLTSDEDPGENCSEGGTRIDFGIDLNGDMELTEEEITATEYLCNGVDGIDGEDGIDGDDGVDGENGSDGHDSIVITEVIEPGDADCPNGGHLVTVGVDDDDSGTLEQDEVDVSEKLCNGVDGENATCAGNTPPALDSLQINGEDYSGTPVTVPISSDFSVMVNASDADGDTLSYTLSGGFFDIVNNGSGEYVFHGDTEGVFYFSVIISDGCNIAVRNFAVNVSSLIAEYSGPNQNIIFDEYTYHGAFSLFDAPGTWDDICLDLYVYEEPGTVMEYSFYNMLDAHGNYVEFAVGADAGDMKNFAYGEEIGDSLTFSGNSYKNISSYEDYSGIVIEDGEFRNNSGYIGLKFTDGSDVYYGWMQVSVTDYDNANITGTLIDWAYNTIPGYPIPAGYTGL